MGSGAPLSVAPTEHSGRLPPPADHQSEMRAADGPYRSRGYPPVATWTFRRLRALRRPAPRLNRFEPESNLIRPSSLVTRARYPAVDFHTHLGRWLTRAGDWMVPDVSGLRRLMDESNVTTLVNLDGRWGDELERNLDRYDRAHPGRFATFCHLDWQLLENSKHAGSLVDSLEASRAAGARGLKVWKNLGLNVRRKGRLLLPDDPVLDPVWMASGALKLPVVIHVADPVAFFQPVNRKNERLDELLRYPHASQAHLGLTHFRRLISSLESIVARHPDTAFVGAHVGCYSEDLTGSVPCSTDTRISTLTWPDGWRSWVVSPVPRLSSSADTRTECCSVPTLSPSAKRTFSCTSGSWRAETSISHTPLTQFRHRADGQ